MAPVKFYPPNNFSKFYFITYLCLSKKTKIDIYIILIKWWRIDPASIWYPTLVPFLCVSQNFFLSPWNSNFYHICVLLLPKLFTIALTSFLICFDMIWDYHGSQELEQSCWPFQENQDRTTVNIDNLTAKVDQLFITIVLQAIKVEHVNNRIDYILNRVD